MRRSLVVRLRVVASGSFLIASETAESLILGLTETCLRGPLSSSETGQPVLDSTDGSDAPSLCAVYAPNGCRRSSVSTPYMEDDASKVLFWN